MQAPSPDPASASFAKPSSRFDPSVSPEEIARFGALAAHWWDPDGPMRPLHRMNRLRVDWVRRQIGRRIARQSGRVGLLDLGCGAGLASEALAASGYDVLGVDASAEAIEAAIAHRRLAGGTLAGGTPAGGALDTSNRAAAGTLEYRCGSAETLVAEGRRFDAVVALEIIEHVTDPADFLMLLQRLSAPGGVIVISTLNRTWRSLAAAKIGAEYLLRMLPVGTHDWRKFVTPAELGRYAGQAGLRVSDIAGMVPGPRGWRESRDTSVNYIAALSGASA